MRKELFEVVTWVELEPVMGRSGGIVAQVEGRACEEALRCLLGDKKDGWRITE